MPKFQVKDWDKHFENDRSRTRDKCSFVCVPNKQHGMGFCRIMSEPDGAAIYGIWQMILGACSQQSRPRHGWLTANGDSTGSPWGAVDLALKFRRPLLEVQRALSVLSSEHVGWLTVDGPLTADSPPTHRDVTDEAPSTHLEGKGREGKGENGMESKLVATVPKNAKELPFKAPPFKKPDIQSLELYAQKIGLPPSQATAFYDYYEANGWRVGKNPMKSWEAGMRYWKGTYEQRRLSSGADGKKPLTPFDIKTIMQAKRDQAMAIKNKHCSETAMDSVWNNGAAKEQYFKLMKEVKELNQKLGAYQ